MKTICFIDLDGVMVNLERGLQEKLGFRFPKDRNEYNKKVVEAMWDDLAVKHPTFWFDLEPTPYQKELYHKILELDPYPIMLSATPEHYTGEKERLCREQKISWVHKHIGPYQSLRSIITKSKLKQEYIKQLPADRHILIDDHPGNIQRWNTAGGIAVHHTDIEKTLKELENLK